MPITIIGNKPPHRLILIHLFPLSLFCSHCSLPTPILSCHVETLASWRFLSRPFITYLFPPSPPPPSWPYLPLLYIPIICKYSSIHAYAAAAHDAMISVKLLRGSRVNQCRADLEHDTPAIPRFRCSCSAIWHWRWNPIRQIWRAIDVEQCGFKPTMSMLGLHHNAEL